MLQLNAKTGLLALALMFAASHAQATDRAPDDDGFSGQIDLSVLREERFTYPPKGLYGEEKASDSEDAPSLRLNLNRYSSLHLADRSTLDAAKD
ncbi:hypothetical protein [Geopseudomonas aromaticivorans]